MPMMFNPQENQQETQTQERRYDPETLRKVTALATRLQHDHHETLTASQMEAIGVEVGLKPEFIQQAIAKLEEEHAQQEQTRQRQEEESKQQQEQVSEQRRQHEHIGLNKTVVRTETTAGKAEFYSVCAALAVPLIFGFLAYYFKSGTTLATEASHYGQTVIVPRTTMMQLFTLMAPWPLALLQGFAVGKRRVGFIAAATLILALAPTVPFLFAVSPGDYQHILTDLANSTGIMFLYALMAIPIAGTLGVAGAWMRQHYFPFGGKTREATQPLQHKEYAAPRPQNSPPLHAMQAAPSAQMHPHFVAQPYTQAQQAQNNQAQTSYAQNVQPQAQTPFLGTRTRRACLSLDVAEKDVLRQSATLVAVDYSFGQFRSWVEEIVRGCGGELGTGSGGVLQATFAADAQAVRAARLLQERLPQFNQSLNRLPRPFRLRAAISAGEAGASVVTERSMGLTDHVAPFALPLPGTNVVMERSLALLRTAEGGDTLISSEVGAAALAELGQLTPLPASLMGEMAFVWRAKP